MLTGFPTIVVCGRPNVAGVSASVEAIALDQVAAFDVVVSSAGEQRAEVELVAGASWLPIALLESSGEWREEQDRSDFGPFFNMNFEAFLPGDSPVIRAELTRWAQHRWLLRLRAKAGGTFVVGDPERLGLRFSSKFESGPQRGQRLTFSGIGLGLTPGYNPVF